MGEGAVATPVEGQIAEGRADLGEVLAPGRVAGAPIVRECRWRTGKLCGDESQQRLRDDLIGGKRPTGVAQVAELDRKAEAVLGPAVALDDRFFAATGHSLCDPYLRYWEQHGGLERFGYPITEPFYETVEDQKLQVQYFERRRIEVHPQPAGSTLLLGLLGSLVRATPEPLTRYPDCLAQALPSLRDVQLGKPLGCPSLAPLPDVPAATQAFERGVMLWTDIRGPNGQPPRLAPAVPPIFALTAVGTRAQSYADPWVAGQDPDRPAATPPSSGLYAPWRGFGKVWMADPELRAAIGWATQPEAQAHRADIQLFSTVLLIRIKETGATYAFGNTNTPGNAQVIRPWLAPGLTRGTSPCAERSTVRGTRSFAPRRSDSRPLSLAW